VNGPALQRWAAERRRGQRTTKSPTGWWARPSFVDTPVGYPGPLLLRDRSRSTALGSVFTEPSSKSRPKSHTRPRESFALVHTVSRHPWQLSSIALVAQALTTDGGRRAHRDHPVPRRAGRGLPRRRYGCWWPSWRGFGHAERDGMAMTAGRETGAKATSVNRTKDTKGGQGQWALGERKPLNANERFKLEDDALNVRARIEQVYAREVSTRSRRRTWRVDSAGGACIPSASRV